MKNNLLVLLGFLLNSIPSFCQITGEITSELDNSSIAYASVYWEKSRVGVLSNESGEFSISEPSEQKDSLVISYVGYKPLKVSRNDLNLNHQFKLELAANLKEIVVESLTAEEILAKAYRNKQKNHFRNKTFQPGYSETQFYDDHQLFQVSQASYNITHQVDSKNDPSQELFINKVRSVVDSALFKSINNELNFKKFDSTFGPEIFLNIGQSMNFDTSSTKSKKIKFETKLVDELDYQGENVYFIETLQYYKKKPLLKSKFYIEKESFAFLYVDHETVKEVNLNKAISGAGKILLRILGFQFNIRGAKIVSYYKRNNLDPNIFDLEKGFSTIELDVKRTDRWIKGKIAQEFYLLPKQTLIEPLKEDFSKTQTLVANFDNKDFFQGVFHLPTRKSTIDKIAFIQENNANYKGGIASDRFEKWNAKQERKEERRKKRKEK